MMHVHLVDHPPDEHQARAAAGHGRVGHLPRAPVADPAFQLPVRTEHRLHPDHARLAGRVSVLDGIADDFPHRQLQGVLVLGERVELAQPPSEGMPGGAQAGQAGGQLQVQPGNRGGQPLRGQRDHLAPLGGLAPQQPGGVLGDPVSARRRAAAAGEAHGAGRRGRIRELGHALVQGLGGLGGQRAAAEQQQVTRLEPGTGRRPGGAGAERARMRGRQAAGPAVSPGDHWGRLAAGGVL